MTTVRELKAAIADDAMSFGISGKTLDVTAELMYRLLPIPKDERAEFLKRIREELDRTSAPNRRPAA